MAIGFGLLGLAPRAFWSLTLAELDAAVRGRLGGALPGRPPARSELTALMKRFPDLED
mgnify:FL=1